MVLRCYRAQLQFEIGELRVFSSLTPGQRLRWLEELREWTWKAASEETKRSWARLRRGE